MHLTNLNLTDFRSYERLGLALSPGISVLLGDNATGKTTLLEAIYFLATTRSHRSSSDAELINRAAIADMGAPPFSRLLALVERARGDLRVEIVIARDAEREINQQVSGLARKQVKINGVARRAADLIGQVNVVMFAPEDMALVTTAPAARRRYLDMTISQVDHRYMLSLAQYNKVLLQRNALLRDIRDRGRNSSSPAVREEMVYWNGELAQAGAYVSLRRQDFLLRLSALAEPLHEQLVGTGAPLCLLYSSAVAPNVRANLAPTLAAPRPPATPQLAAGIPQVHRLTEQVQTEFAAQLEAARQDEARRGVSLIGPHRDDFSFSLGDGPQASPLAVYGSRGQQRSAILALKLAELALMEQEVGDRPILLLDDILSELDASRRQFLLETVRANPRQVLITGTAAADFEPSFLQDATRYRVAAGRVTELAED